MMIYRYTESVLWPGLFFVFISGLFFSCETFNKDEVIPSYLYIADIDLSTNDADEGADSENISDAWVFVNDQSIGVYELPAWIPVLESGTTHIKIGSGIKNNGIAASRKMYPFFDFIDFDLHLQASHTDTLDLTASYTENLNFWFSGFESGINLLTTENSDTVLQWTQDPEQVFEGSKSAVAYIDQTNRYFEVRTDQNFGLPVGGVPVYLELDYKISNSIAVGIYSYQPNGEIDRILKEVLRPTTNNDGATHYWNKIYIDLTNVVSGEPDASHYEVYIESNLDDGRTEGTLLFDNFKLVYP